MAAGTLTSRVLGFARLALLGSIVGLGLSGDAFEVANSLPNQFYLLLAGGVLNAVLVPQITRAASHPDGGADYVNRLLTLSLTLLVGSTAVVTLAAPLLTQLFWSAGPGSAGLALATTFAFLCLPQILFYGIYTLIGQVLNARGHFVAYMWAPVVSNVVGIAGLVVLGLNHPHFPEPRDWTPAMIAILAGSATLGVAAQAAVLVVPLRRSGFVFRPAWGFRGVGLRGASRVALWTVAAVGVSQLGFVATSRVLTAAAEQLARMDLGEGGGRAGYAAAFLIFMLPHSLITVSLVTALFPRMSRAAHEGRTADLVTDLGSGLRMPAVLLVPITIGSIVLAQPALRVLFPTNDRATTTLVAQVVVAMLLGVVPYGWLYLIQRAFYAYEDARTPFLLQVAVTVVAVSAAVSSLLVDPGRTAIVVGIGQTTGNTLAALLGFWLLRRRLGRLGLSPTIRMYVRMVAAAVVAAVVVGPGMALLGLGLDGRMPPLVQLVLGGTSYVALTLALAHGLRVREVEQLLGPVLRHLPGGLGR